MSHLKMLPRLKRVQSENQLKAGRYIRAVVNYTGGFWVETVEVCGKPFTERHYFASRAIRVRNFHIRDQSYLSDLGVGKGRKLKVLIPFSSKMLNQLQAIKCRHEFCEVLLGRQISNDEYEGMVIDWEYEERMDRMYK